MAALILGGVAVSSLEPAPPKVKLSEVPTGTVHRGDFVRTVRAHGILVPNELQLVSAYSDGRVEKVRVKPGAQVDKDTVIVELSNPGLIQQTQEAGWAVEVAEAELQSLQAELERTILEAEGVVARLRSELEGEKLETDAKRDLVEQGAVSKIGYHQSLLRTEQLGIRLRLEEERLVKLKESVQAQMMAQQTRLEQAKRLYQQRLTQVEDLRIRADFSGIEASQSESEVYVVQEVFVEQGQQLVLGAEVARVAKQDKLVAELAVNESQAGEIYVGQKVSMDICGKKAGQECDKVPGLVTRIDPAVRNGEVRIDVEPTAVLPTGARPDLSIKALIEIEHKEDALFVARPRFSISSNEMLVFRVDLKNKEAYRVPVGFGALSASDVEIVPTVTGPVIGEGDILILSDEQAWQNYQQLRLY